MTLSHRVRLVPWLRPLEPLLRRLNQAQSQRAVEAMKTSFEGLTCTGHMCRQRRKKGALMQKGEAGALAVSSDTFAAIGRLAHNGFRVRKRPRIH